MNALLAFLGSSTGRAFRVVAGAVLVAIGIWAVSGAWTWILVIVGLVPLLAGLLDRCVFAPLAGLPFDGSGLRQALTRK